MLAAACCQRFEGTFQIRKVGNSIQGNTPAQLRRLQSTNSELFRNITVNFKKTGKTDGHVCEF